MPYVQSIPSIREAMLRALLTPYEGITRWSFGPSPSRDLARRLSR
jgi:hypothetical protein